MKFILVAISALVLTGCGTMGDHVHSGFILDGRNAGMESTENFTDAQLDAELKRLKGILDASNINLWRDRHSVTKHDLEMSDTYKKEYETLHREWTVLKHTESRRAPQGASCKFVDNICYTVAVPKAAIPLPSSFGVGTVGYVYYKPIVIKYSRDTIMQYARYRYLIDKKLSRNDRALARNYGLPTN
jgi:hypothetical protein